MFDVGRLDTNLTALPLAKCQGRISGGGGFAIFVIQGIIPIFVVEDAQSVLI
jgi:hypothetical protein